MKYKTGPPPAPADKEAPQLTRALAVFSRVPIVGQVKTRLAPVLTLEGAADLYRCFLLDTVSLAMRVGRCKALLVYTPREASRVLRDMVEQPIDLIPQSSGDLGSRMNDAFKDLFACGYESCVMIGGDLPTLPLSRLRTAFSALERSPVVLGPSLDGGYYLIGLRVSQPALFEGITWSTPQVLGQTIDRINRLGLEVHCLEPWYDVDTAEDLDFLVSHVRLLMACGGSDLPRQTVNALRWLGLL